ncbi:restriction endonuclease subunit S, partial [Klebsiella aerogenes]
QKLFSQQIRFKADDGSEFGEWEKIKFLDLMVDLWDYRGKTPKKLGMDWGDGEIQSLSALNIKKGFIDFDADCHLGSEKLYKTWMNKGDLEKDDIIFTMEAPLGNVALIPDDRKYILSQRVVCFKTNKKMIDNKFIFQLILS